MKTKAFSKEGLIQAAQMNPEQRAKAEVTNWISSQVDELARQVEAAEAELEMLNSSVKKGKKGGSGPGGERVGQLDTLNERRNWHVSRLEILLRLVENGQVDADRVSDVKDDISYFVESNAVSVKPRMGIVIAQLLTHCLFYFAGRRIRRGRRHLRRVPPRRRRREVRPQGQRRHQLFTRQHVSHRRRTAIHQATRFRGHGQRCRRAEDTDRGEQEGEQRATTWRDTHKEGLNEQCRRSAGTWETGEGASRNKSDSNCQFQQQACPAKQYRRCTTFSEWPHVSKQTLASTSVITANTLRSSGSSSRGACSSGSSSSSATSNILAGAGSTGCDARFADCDPGRCVPGSSSTFAACGRAACWSRCGSDYGRCARVACSGLRRGRVTRRRSFSSTRWPYSTRYRLSDRSRCRCRSDVQPCTATQCDQQPYQWRWVVDGLTESRASKRDEPLTSLAFTFTCQRSSRRATAGYHAASRRKRRASGDCTAWSACCELGGCGGCAAGWWRSGDACAAAGGAETAGDRGREVA